MDLSKAYNCLPHDLIAKLVACGFDNTALTLITDKATNRHQWMKIGAAFSSYLEILRNVSKKSILGPILFNLFINNVMIFIKKTEVCKFANDTTIHSCSLNYKEAHQKLSNDTHIVPNCFRINSMVANPGKSQIVFLRSSINNNNITFIVENKHIKSTNKVKLLGIIIDHKLTFTKHINYAIQQVKCMRALTRIRTFLSQVQTKGLSEAYIMSTFKYCPLM